MFAVDEWPEHVTVEQEPNWIVVDDTTLKRPPKKKLSAADGGKSPLSLTQSLPTPTMKVCDRMCEHFCMIFGNINGHWC